MTSTFNESECKYCNKIFSNKHILKQHQKTAKYCLEKQGNMSSFNCEYCNKILSTNDRLHTHYIICKEKQKVEISKDIKSVNENLKQTVILLEEKLKDKDEYISKLEIRLQKFESVVINNSKKSNTINNNTIINMINLI